MSAQISHKLCQLFCFTCHKIAVLYRKQEYFPANFGWSLFLYVKIKADNNQLFINPQAMVVVLQWQTIFKLYHNEATHRGY